MDIVDQERSMYLRRFYNSSGSSANSRKPALIYNVRRMCSGTLALIQSYVT